MVNTDISHALGTVLNFGSAIKMLLHYGHVQVGFCITPVLKPVTIQAMLLVQLHQQLLLQRPPPQHQQHYYFRIFLPQIRRLLLQPRLPLVRCIIIVLCFKHKKLIVIYRLFNKSIRYVRAPMEFTRIQVVPTVRALLNVIALE